MQASAVTIVGVGGERPLEGRNRPSPVARLEANLAERKPCRREARRELQRLLHELGGGRQIARRRKVARALIAAVGDEVAGGCEQQGRHHESNRFRRNDPIHI